MFINNIVKNDKSRYSWILGITLLFFIAIRLFFVSHNLWPINGDEAQYWGWSKHLAFGYYSKPPMLAWLIAIFTYLFGDGWIGLRIASILCHSLTAILIYLIGTKLYQPRIGFWAALIYFSAPGVIFASSIISTDAPLLLFWALALYAFILALSTPVSGGYWLLCGIFLGLAFLSKYAAIFFVISMFLYLLFSTKERKQLLTPGPYLALTAMFLILLPNIVWNYQHHFVSLQEVKANANLAGSWFHFNNLFEFIAAQFGMFNPIMFTVFLIMLLIAVMPAKAGTQASADQNSLGASFRWYDKMGVLFAFILPIFFIMCIEAFLSRAHANWSAPMYVALSVAGAAFLINRKKIAWLWVALMINLVVQAGFFNLKPLIKMSGIHINPASSTLNWEEGGRKICQYQRQYPNSLLLVDNRMLLAQVLYFSKAPLSTLFKWNPSQVIRDHYDMVTVIQKEIGKNFIYVTYNNNPQDTFKYFKRVVSLTPVQLPTMDGQGVTIYMFYLENFKGY
jgi:4-amino-4-deoxy-L-arabinose transferase-like glycosyltransferase